MGSDSAKRGEEKLLLTILPRPRSSRWCFGDRSCSHALGACGRRSLSHRRKHVLCQPSSADAGDHCDLLPDVRICPRANVGDVVSRAVTPEGLVRAAIARSGPCRQRYVTGRRKGEIWPASREVAFRSLILDASSTPSGPPTAWRKLRRATDANAVSWELTRATCQDSGLLVP